MIIDVCRFHRRHQDSFAARPRVCRTKTFNWSKSELLSKDMFYHEKIYGRDPIQSHGAFGLAWLISLGFFTTLYIFNRKA